MQVPRGQRPPVPRSSEYPALRRDHWGVGRPLLRSVSIMSGVRFHELNWKEPLWRVGIAWNRNSEKLSLISGLVKVVRAVAGDQEV